MRKSISSVNNPLIKETNELKLKKYRAEYNAFIIEGARSTEEAVNSEWEILRSFVDISADSKLVQAVASRLESMGVPLYEVSSDVMQKLSDTGTPQGILAVVKRKKFELNDFNQTERGLLLVLDEVRDPGNLGTIVRTADAAGVTGVVLLNGCVDLFAPKTVRATMGSLFHLPIKAEQDKKEFIEWCTGKNWSLWSSALEGAKSIYEVELPERVAVVMGNEAEGVSEEILSASDKRVYIPMPGKAESLNVATAAGVILFECLRQRLATK